MKILLTSDTYLPSINGVVTSIRTLYKELKNRGNDVKILTVSPNGKEIAKGDIYYLKSFDLKLYPGAKGSFSFKSKLFDKIILWKPDIVHSNTEFITMHYANKISKLLNIPHVHTYHTMYEDYIDYVVKSNKFTRKIVKVMSKWAVRKTDGIIVPTEKVKKVLVGYDIESPMSVIPTGIDFTRFFTSFENEEKIELKEQLGINENEKVLLYLGRIGKEKNIEEIIYNFSLDTQGKKLLIVGGGPYILNLEKEVERLNIGSKVIFTGMIKPEEVYKYYKVSDVFLTASVSETQGLTYLEALASGIPVVCRRDGSNEGLIKNNVNGFKYTNEDEYKKFINIVLLRNEQFKKNASLSVCDYSNDIYGKKVAKVYRALIDDKYREKEYYNHAKNVSI